ncbi:FAD-dependent monooxygenase [Steroidobacter sp. S1-65]|uniref:FAD-dependent monooxygenase n=1 Tax=Steroidobacter gossypii TaxID=2805490 RepID=A0ABS1X5F2_9GAMM|nr:NAD(P)/FAD-dependent oxidoreductase [Steroidobacter gossypii]MBM0108459.1 FAD-dependent monooxygenase [Steroidobacter gossypii]
MSSDTHDQPITIVGAGLSGTLLAILMARRGHRVRLYERQDDMRRVQIDAGRSINLALAARGIRALELAGVMERVQTELVPLPGRMLHDLNGALTFVPYGQRPDEVIYSVSRPGLNCILLDAAEQAGVELLFRHPAVGADFSRERVTFKDENRSGETHEVAMRRVFATDGAGSVLRRSMVEQLGVVCTEDLLKHGYKELTLPPFPDGRPRIDKHALHIWPRGGFMLIALPNIDGSFTVTLFLALNGPESFETLTTPGSIDVFFAKHFPDVQKLMPDLATEFLSHPTGIMGTVRSERWSLDEQLLLVGDAAHAITPFHGQGMNCCFEDCRELDALLADSADWSLSFRQFETSRRPNTNAIADMAIENYLEMRDTVRDPKFHLHKALSLELERRHPDRFVPRYSMVMFRDDIPYALAYERGRIQHEILVALTASADTLAAVDYELAARLIEARLTPLPA